MILPIGHRERSVRRLPWVTFSLMAACLVVFLLTDTAAIDAGPDPDDRFEEAADYWRRHAYLEADPAIREHVAYDVMPNQRKQYLATLPDLSEGRRPTDPEGLAAQQRELDRLTDLALGNAQEEGELTAFQRWGVVPASPRASAFVTYMFLHADWGHLLGNLFILLLAGPPIEDRWGRATFAAFYLLSGVFAAVFYSGLALHGTLPMVGASGAIAGVLGAFLVRLWKTQIRFAYFFLFGLRPLMGTFEAPAWAMLPLWFGNELLQGYVWHSVGVASGVAYWAHVGGFLFGVGGAFAVRALRIEERFVDPAVEAQITRFAANPVLEEAMAARGRGEVGEALALLRAEWERQPDDDIGLALWDAALGCAQPELGAPALASVVRSAARRGELELALRHWSELSDHVPSERLDPGTLLRFVPLLLEEHQKERAVVALRQALHPENTALSPGQATRALELARELDPPSALAAARQALASPDLHDAKRARLDALVAELEGQGVEAPAPVAQTDAGVPEPVAAWAEDGSIDLSRFARVKLVAGRPLRLEEGALVLALEDDREARVSLHKIQAVAVAVVDDLGPRPVLLIDLLANWNEVEAEELRGARLRSDGFDPRALLGTPGDAKRAFVTLIGRLLEGSRGAPLPTPEAACGSPFARFATLAEYERSVLGVAG